MSCSTAGQNTIPEELIIGLALGSPRENPIPSIPSNGLRQDVRGICSSLDLPAAVRDHNRPDLALQKGRRWKTLTGIFNKKDTSSHFYLLGQNPPRRNLPYQSKTYEKHFPQQFVSQQQVHATQNNHGRRCHSQLRQGLDEQPPPMPRQGIFRSGGADSRGRISWRNTPFRKEHRRDARSLAVKKSRCWPLHILRAKVYSPPRYSSKAHTASPSKLKADSLLDVEIPNIHMERFSVMFANILGPAQLKSGSAQKQGDLADIELAADERAKTESTRVTRVDSDEFENTPVQSATFAQDVALPKSSQVTVPRPPSLSSYPTARAPLERSSFHYCHTVATSSVPIEPKKETFEARENGLLALSSSRGEPLRDEAAPNGPDFTLDLNRDHPLIEGRYQERPHWADFAEKCEVLPPLPLNPGVRKPPLPGRHEESSSISKQSQVKPKEQTVSDAVEISIARQISVSKRQRLLLVPIVSKQARQPMHPKLVTDGGQHAESRKSHYLMFEHT
ncbi:hypothetical protein MMC07_009521 [Pseudocyphellaria aurata]|nr:hypothetical protein [Pseudocyphellaria aurata]